MNIILRQYSKNDLPEMIEIWNEVVEEGVAFPQMESLTLEEGESYFGEQSYCGVAENTDTKEVLGLYTLHPNNIGRCGHISNASYAVKSNARGCHIGEMMVKNSLDMGRKLGFSLLQFNAVVKTNASARHIYEKLGFVELGIIPKGYLLKSGAYEDIVLYYHEL